MNFPEAELRGICKINSPHLHPLLEVRGKGIWQKVQSTITLPLRNEMRNPNVG